MEKDAVLSEWSDLEIFEYTDEDLKKYQMQQMLKMDKQQEKTVEEFFAESEKIGVLERTLKKITVQDVFFAAYSYLKRNWIFLLTVSLIWMITGSEDYLIPLFNTPVVGRPLVGISLFLSQGPVGYVVRYLTATYNGPVWNLSVYTFFVAITAKSAYVLGMTGVVFPSIKELLQDKKRTTDQYKNIIENVKKILKDCVKNKEYLGIAISGLGIALVISNFLSRNGKFDKTFILLILFFIVLKGVCVEIPSVLHFIFSRLIHLMLLVLPNGKKNMGQKDELVRVGLATGFLLAVMIGSFGERAGYISGIIALIAGFVICSLKKGNLINGNEKNS